LIDAILSDTAASTQWRAVPQDTLLFAHWEGQSVLFHEPSGRTHLLNEATVVLLTRILLEPRTAGDACRELADDDALAGDPEYSAGVQDALLWLEDLGLVERC
jgi:PqqD family protein of HPr-rel-A system